MTRMNIYDNEFPPTPTRIINGVNLEYREKFGIVPFIE